MSHEKQQELFFTQNARRVSEPKLDLKSTLLFTVSSSGLWNFIVGFLGFFCSSLLMRYFVRKEECFMAYLQSDSGASWEVCPRKHI